MPFSCTAISPITPQNFTPWNKTQTWELLPQHQVWGMKKELNQSNPAHRSITALLPHHHRRKKHPPVRTQGLREQTAFSRTRISLPEKPIAPVLHWLITDFSRDLLYHLRGNHASRTNPMIPQQVTVDTFPQELFPCLPRAFSFAPSKEQRWPSIKYWGIARMLLPGCSGTPALPSSTMRGVWSHPWGYTPGRWASLKGSDKRVPAQDTAMIGNSKGGGGCCDCSQQHLARLVTSCLSCHSEMRGCNVKRDPLNTNAMTQKQQFKAPSFPPRETAWLVMTLIYCQIYIFFWNYSQRGLCLNPFSWIDNGITSYLGGNEGYKKKKSSF